MSSRQHGLRVPNALLFPGAGGWRPAPVGDGELERGPALPDFPDPYHAPVLPDSVGVVGALRLG